MEPTGPKMTRRAAASAAAAILAGRWSAEAAPVVATVVGTDLLALRADPAEAATPTAAPVATVPLGARVEQIDGERAGDLAQGDFLRVRVGGVEGYAQDWYLREEGHSAPYLLQGAPGCGRVAFLFNVGIGAEPDLGILDTLKREQVPAAMFVMGWWADRRPPALARMVADGHAIASHGYEAVELTARDDDGVAADVLAAAAAIERATGRPPARLFTPYAAAMDERVRSVVAATGFLPVAWTVAAADYGPDATADGVLERVVTEVHDGALVEFHLDGPASAASTGHALPSIIHRLRDDGFRFVTVPEMLAPCRVSDAGVAATRRPASG